MDDAELRVREQTERILNLLIALRAAPGWIDRDTLKSCMDEYRGLGDAAFDKAFSRDKALLRGMGIEISTSTWNDAVTGENGYGYRITQDDYRLPQIDLTPEEAAVLSVANRFWQDTAVAEHSGRALDKLRGLGIDLRAEEEQPGIGPRFDSEAFAAALSAVNARRAVAFDYRRPGGTPSARRLEPYVLLTRGDRVYLIGRDIDKDDIRTFRLSRIQGRITRVSRRRDGDYTVPDDFRTDDWFRPDRASGPERTAVLHISSGRADPLRRVGTVTGRADDEPGDDGRDIVEVPFDDARALASRLLGFGAAVRVAGPLALVDAHRDAVRATLDSLERAASSDAAAISGGAS